MLSENDGFMRRRKGYKFVGGRFHQRTLESLSDWELEFALEDQQDDIAFHSNDNAVFAFGSFKGQMVKEMDQDLRRKKLMRAQDALALLKSEKVYRREVAGGIPIEEPHLDYLEQRCRNLAAAIREAIDHHREQAVLFIEDEYEEDGDYHLERAQVLAEALKQ